MSKCQFPMMGMTFFLAIFINKKISGRKVAGYSMVQTAFRKECFCCFLIVS